MASTTTTTPLITTHNDLEQRPESTESPTGKVLAGLLVSVLVLSSLAAVIYNQPQKPEGLRQSTTNSRGVGWPEKVFGGDDSIEWQRSAYHFQPDKNFISDPDGPLYYKGWYHLFYQYNPYSAIWGNISWGHAVSKDLINWFHLPLAMVPDHWYDIQGVMTGSATFLPDGQIFMLYSGNAYDLSQLQCLAYPPIPPIPSLSIGSNTKATPFSSPLPASGSKTFVTRPPSGSGPMASTEWLWAQNTTIR
ncbi:hypothetical protein L1987_75929 [Smallanthus sonchifolius]|uniref:Uncharacterized protein n=1 Tax=Smallanthus sonchifolius TaxID=185202 RepID=A0ACB9A736_9ASTR|nr:hypothetical protein L1987_75929 [Smallanthus sonchifolius]